MVAHQIPCGDQGSPADSAGWPAIWDDEAENSTLRWPFDRQDRAKCRYLRRNGPVGVQLYLQFARLFRSAGMTSPAVRHVPVLGREAVEMLAPRDGGVYVDATFGAGGYSRALLAAADTRVIGIDRDRSAIAGGFDLVEQSGGRLTLVEDRFSNLAGVCAAQGVDSVDGV